MKIAIILTTVILSGQAFASGQQLDCSYNFMGAPTAEVILSFDANGILAPTATIKESVADPGHQETVTAVPADPGESMHLWISKESAENSVEMIVYSSVQADGNSVLINHHMPFGQQMWGDCK